MCQWENGALLEWFDPPRTGTPDAAAYCGDREPTGGLRDGEGDAGPCRDHPGRVGGGCRPFARQPRRLRRVRPLQRNPPAPPAVRIRRHRTSGAADPRLPPCSGTARVAHRDRPGHPCRLRARSVHPQDRRDPAALLGRPVPPATVSRVTGTPDAAVAALHGRRFDNRYKSLMPDSVVPTPSGVPSRLPSASSPTGARGLSTSNLPVAKAPPNGSARRPHPTDVTSPAKAPK